MLNSEVKKKYSFEKNSRYEMNTKPKFQLFLFIFNKVYFWSKSEKSAKKRTQSYL